MLLLLTLTFASPDQFQTESGYTMVQIPAGRFMMGAGAKKENEHEVVLTHSFYMGVYEVEQGFWGQFRDNNASKFQDPKKPISNVNFFDVVMFANSISKKEGLEECYEVTPQAASWPKGYSCDGYRLPTEAEWEYVALGDQESFSDLELDEYAWSKRNSQKTTHPVGSKKANVYGVYDMLGNVWEWVWDIHGAYPSTEIIDPTGAKKGPFRIRRGGGYSSGASRVNPTKRYALNPINEHSFLGFRLVRTVKK